MKQMHWNAQHTLMEEGGFELIAQPKEYWVSWVSHKDCPSPERVHRNWGPWRCVDGDRIEERWVNIYEGHCTYCSESVPEGIKGAWILHNYENHLKALHIRSRKGLVT